MEFSKENCIKTAKERLVAARSYRLKGDLFMSIYCLNRAADWRRHASYFNRH